ncbi:MAG: hypothetical protein ABIH69_03680 [bacterium]
MKKTVVIILIISMFLLSMFNALAYADMNTSSISSKKLRILADEERRTRLASGLLRIVCSIVAISWGMKNLESMSNKSYSTWSSLFLDVLGSPFVMVGASVVGYQGLEAIVVPSKAEKDYVEMMRLDDVEREIHVTESLKQYNEKTNKKDGSLSERVGLISKPFDYDELRFENQEEIDKRTQDYFRRSIFPKIEDGTLWREKWRK